MTDSVEKNLHIENGNAAALGSSLISLHLLCTTVCKPTQLRHWIDWTSMSLQVLKILSNSEKHLNQLIHVWNHSYELNKLVVCVSSSQFSILLVMINHYHQQIRPSCLIMSSREKKKFKHLSLHQERRFARLGYSCASILDVMPYVQMVLN